MGQKVSDYILQRIKEWGIHRVYGYPGDGINGFLGAYDRAGGDPEFIQPRHEEMAAFMACAHAKFTGEVGCCTATSGPGAIHLLNGLYDAKLDHQPVLAIRSPSSSGRAPPSPPRRSWRPPQAVASALSPRLPDRAILTADSGSSTTWWARQLKLREDMKASLSGTLATMGPGTPYAIAVKFAFPDRPVIAFVGDGAFQMNGMNEMITVKRYRDRLGDGPLIFCVFNNQDLNQVTWEQRAMAGDPKFMGSQYIPDVPYHKWAELLGLTGIYCDDQSKVGAAWDRALAADGPVVLEFKVDQEVAPLPPHIMWEQGKKAVKAGIHDPEKASIAMRGFRQKLAEVFEALPGRDGR